MEQKYGKLVWTDDENDRQEDYVKEGTEKFLLNMGVKRAEEVIEKITNVFMDNGDMRGRIFYNRKYQPIDETKGPLRMPVYGVKGKHGGEKSRANYTHWYVEREKDLLGESFFREIFGNYFGTEEEYRLLKKPEEMFEKQVEDRYTTKEDNVQDILIVYIMERLWEALEQDPSSRIVIVLSKRITSEDAEKSAEEESMDILRQIYRMMPQRLRLTMGFATCVTPIEIVSLVEKENLPIRIFTTEIDSDLTKLNDRYHVIRIDEEDLHTCNETRKKWLEKLLEFKAKDQLEELLNRSEAEYLEREKKEVNFGAYEAILNPIIIPWYEKEKNGDLLALLKYRKEQETVLTCGSLEKERMTFFLGQVLPNKTYWRDLVQFIYSYNNNTPQNEEYDIDEIREKLGLGYLIDAMQETWKYAQMYYVDKLKREEELSKRLQDEKNDQETTISELGAEIEKERNKNEELIADNNDKRQQIESLSKDSENKELEIGRLNKEIESCQEKITKLEEEHTNKVSRYEQEVKSLSEEVSELNETNRDLMQRNEALEKELARKTEEELWQRFTLKVTQLEKNNEGINGSLKELCNEVNKLKENNEKINDSLKGLCNEVNKLEENNEGINGSLKELYDEVNKLKEKKGIIHYLKKLSGVSKCDRKS